MRRTDILVVFVILTVMSGCRLKRPDDVLSPKKMERFLYDYHLAQAISQDLPKEEKYTTAAYIDWAYSKNGITKEQFNTSLVWYTRNPKELSKIYKRLSNRVDDEYKSASKAFSKIEKKLVTIQSGDSIDMWYLEKTALLNTSVYMNRLTYAIQPDTTFHSGDTICLNMSGTFVSTDSGVPQHAYISLSAYYRDSVSTADTMLMESGPVSLSLVLDKMDLLSGISGSINYLDPTDSRNSIFVLSGMELMRYHNNSITDTVSVNLAGSKISSAEL